MVLIIGISRRRIYKIKILPARSWMLSFTIRLYQSYRYDDIRISGYNYGANYWYQPKADLLNSSATSMDVRFGYDSAYNLWVAVPAGAYTGLEIIDITNGYTQVNQDWSKNFTIVNQTSLTGTVQTTQTVYRPLKYNENAASATTLQTTRTIWGQSFNGSANVSGAITGATTGTFSGNLTVAGNVGIGLTNPGAKLDLSGGVNYLKTAGVQSTILGSSGNVMVMADNSGNLYSVTPSTFFSTSTAAFLPLAGGTMSGSIAMGANNITGIGTLTASKITASTFDPLYTINGINYSTYAPAVAGGVREEYIGKIKIDKAINDGVYEAVLDFDNLKTGSDLWLWRKVVDFNKDNVDIAITPYGDFARVYYLIENNHLIFRSDSKIEISYRLIGRRFDWRDWGTLSEDQTTQGMER